MNRTGKSRVIAAAAAVMFCTLSLPVSAAMAQDYPAPWKRDAVPALTRTLAKNGVRGCGDFAWRQRADGSSEYLVYCTRDGRTWSAWLAWTASEKVQGPYSPDAALPLP